MMTTIMSDRFTADIFKDFSRLAKEHCFELMVKQGILEETPEGKWALTEKGLQEHKKHLAEDGHSLRLPEEKGKKGKCSDLSQSQVNTRAHTRTHTYTCARAHSLRTRRL